MTFMRPRACERGRLPVPDPFITAPEPEPVHVHAHGSTGGICLV